MRPPSRPLQVLAALAVALAVPQPAAAIGVGIDTSQDRRPIDPRIYGVNFGTAAQLGDPGYTVRRWGGNSTTRYNWQADVHNTAADYFFQNIADGDGTDLPAQSTLNAFIAETLAAGAEPIVTIGTIGWTPDAERVKKWGFSQAKYGAQTLDECRFYAPNPPFWCSADAGNGECSGGASCGPLQASGVRYIVGNDPDDTSFATDASWAASWVAHLRGRHGTAAAGGVRYYALDNEPMLWNSTHRDVHPAPLDYDGLWTRTVAYATAIKATEPQAEVFGPVSWGYCDLFSSAADGCHVGADRDAHDGLPLVQWYLRQVCTHQQQSGVRLVDWLDLHYYPQGANVVDFGGNLAVSETAEVSARRLRSLKELYDPAWSSESWIGTLGNYDANVYNNPFLLRRVRAWIDAECPGTKLAITEYNWGPDQGTSAALAQAELLAIFGREGVDLATRWVAPAAGSKVEEAFRLFLDYDGNGSRIVGTSVRALSADTDALGAYAVEDADGGRLLVLLFNKLTTGTSAELALGQVLSGAWQLYRFDGGSDLAPAGSGAIDGDSLALPLLPARSATLLVLPLGQAGVAIFRDGFEPAG